VALCILGRLKGVVGGCHEAGKNIGRFNAILI